MIQKCFCISLILLLAFSSSFSIKAEEDTNQLSATGVAIGFAKGILDPLGYVLYPASKISDRVHSLVMAAEKSTLVQKFETQSSQMRSAYYLGYALAQSLIAFALAEFATAAQRKNGANQLEYLPLIPATLSAVNIFKGLSLSQPDDKNTPQQQEPAISNATIAQRRLPIAHH